MLTSLHAIKLTVSRARNLLGAVQLAKNACQGGPHPRIFQDFIVATYQCTADLAWAWLQEQTEMLQDLFAYLVLQIPTVSLEGVLQRQKMIL
jgi:hypothetical protein